MRNAIQNPPKTSFKTILAQHWKSLLTCVGLVISTNVTYYMLLTYMPETVVAPTCIIQKTTTS